MSSDKQELAAAVFKAARIRGNELEDLVLNHSVLPTAMAGSPREVLIRESLAVGFCAIQLLVKSRGLLGIVSEGHPEGTAPVMSAFMGFLEEEFSRAGIPVQVTIVEKAP